MRGKKLKGLSTGDLMINTMAALSGLKEVDRSDVFRDEFNGIIVDTVCAFDTHVWETAVNRNGCWFIVAQYKDREEAKREHTEWVKLLLANPCCELRDIDIFDLGLNGDEENETG